MREIIFKGKRMDNGEWVYGSLFVGFKKSYICPEAIAMYNFDGALCLGGFIEVDPSTVGQYTGLIDKNGVNIFEGDIVDLFGMKGKVVQECGAFGIGFMKTIDYDLLESKIPFNNSANFCFNDNFISLWEVFWNYEQDDNPLYEVEIIGNVHDNPDLLLESKEEK